MVFIVQLYILGLGFCIYNFRSYCFYDVGGMNNNLLEAWCLAQSRRACIWKMQVWVSRISDCSCCLEGGEGTICERASSGWGQWEEETRVLPCSENSLCAPNPWRCCTSLQQVVRGVTNHRQSLLG